MTENEFRKIENIAEYLKKALSDGSLVPGRYQKKGEFRARPGVIGERIETIMADGLRETVNTVRADENGNPGWVVTGMSGEEYIVEDSVFRDKYQPAEGREGVYVPRSAPIIAAELQESICFTAPWGEEMRVVRGGYLVFTNPPDIYGIQRAEFEATYEKI